MLTVDTACNGAQSVGFRCLATCHDRCTGKPFLS